MVRHYTRKKAPLYTREDIQNAVRAVREEKMKLLTASKKFNVPRSTLHDQLPFTTESTDHAQNSTEECVAVDLVGCCTIHNEVTPIRLELKGYFAKILQKNHNPVPVEKRRAKPNFYGEALTTDELLYTRLAAEDEEKKKQEEQMKKKEEQQRKREEQLKKGAEKKEEQQKKKEEQQKKKEEQQRKKEEQQRKREEQQVKQAQQKKEGTMRKRAVSITKVARRKSHSHYKRKSSLARSKSTTPSNNEECCQECGLYVNDDEDMWIGCDNCTNWYHYTCLGLSHIPKDDIWLCLYCE